MEPVKDVDECVVGGLLRDVLKLRTADPSELAAAARQLVDGDLAQHIVKPGDRLVMPRVSGPKLLDPPSGVASSAAFLLGRAPSLRAQKLSQVAKIGHRAASFFERSAFPLLPSS